MLIEETNDNYLKNKGWNSLLKFLFLFCPLFIGIWNFPLRILGFQFEMTPGDLGDPRFINYILEHGYQFLQGKQDNFYDAPFFYPYRNTVSLSDNMIGSLPIYSLFRLIGFERETSLQLWWLSVFFLNYFISFYCFKRFSGNFYVSVIAAWLFTFSLPNCMHLPYLQVNSKYMLPVIFLNFFYWLKNGENKNFGFFLLAFTYQMLLSVYFTIFTVITVVVILMMHVVVTKSFKPISNLFLQPKHYKWQWLFFISTILLGILFFFSYTKLTDETPFRDYDTIRSNIPRFRSFIAAVNYSNWDPRIGHGDRDFPSNWWFHGFFPGAFVLFSVAMLPLYIYIKWKSLKKEFFVILLSGVFTFFLCIRWNEHFSPLEFLYDTHIFGPITFPSRIMLVIELVYLFALVYMLTDVLKTPKLVFRLLLPWMLIAILIWDHSLNTAVIRGTKKELLAKRYKTLEQAISSQNKNKLNTIAVINEKYPGDFTFVLDVMTISQKLGMKCINGYSSRSPAVIASDFWGQPSRLNLRKYCEINGIDTTKILIIENPNPPNL